MKIYILRHEDRTQDCSFFAPLTRLGLDNSVKLITDLEKLDIDKIYCSPFIRTLQTVYPFSKDKEKLINLEYSLCEIHHEDIIPKKAVGIYLPEYLAESFNYNSEYKTYLVPTEIKYPENDKDVKIRTKRFLRKIIEDYSTEDISILLVTHQPICNAIIKLVNKHSSEFKEKLNTKDYEKGKITLVFNNGWTYKSIN